MKRLLALIAAFLLTTALCACNSTGNTTDPTPKPTGLSSVPSQIEVMREGEVSNIDVETVNGVIGNYAIAMDPTYFVFQVLDDMDYFWYEAWGEDTPVYYSVRPYEGTYDPARFISEVKTNHADRYASCTSEETVIAALNATVVRLSGCTAAPDFNRVVILLNSGEQLYVLETEFTTEMAEGLYPIIMASLNTFTVK